MFEYLGSKWDTFWYNFSWDDYSSYLNGHIAKAAFLIPVFGYALIFNDYVTDQITFENLTNEVRTTFFLNPEHRLRYLFFATIFLASANLLFRFTRPFAMRIGDNLEQYSDYFLKNCPSHVFLRMHQEIRSSEFDPVTIDGKYYDDDWDLFWREAHWSKSGRNLLDVSTDLDLLPEYDRVHFEEAKQRHKSVLLSILRETYVKQTTKKRPQLILCLILATIGYSLLLVPSVDLTLRVFELTFLG